MTIGPGGANEAVPGASVNTDQRVRPAVTDATILGDGRILVEDCRATTTPAFRTEAAVWNVTTCPGLVTGSEAILRALGEPAA